MDLNKIEELIRLLEDSRSEELCISKGDFTVHLRKGAKPKPAGAERQARRDAKEPTTPEAEQPKEQFILAPMVGIFHTVDGAAQVGTKIAKGQVVGVIESMKLLNDVVSDISGTVCEVLVEEGTPVEYGQPLCKVEPA